MEPGLATSSGSTTNVSALPARAAEDRFATPWLASLLYNLEWADMRVKGFRGYYVPTGRTRLYVYEAQGRDPAGPTLLVQHGIASRSAEFRTVVGGLRQYARRIVLVDLPGHGFSEGFDQAHVPDEMWEEWRQAIDALLPEPAVFFGNSLGGGVVVRYALAHPDRVKALVLASPAGAMTTEERLREILRQFDLKDNRDVARLMPKLFLHPPALSNTTLVRSVVRSVFKRPFLQELIANLGTKDLFPAEELRRLQPPTLLLWGELDRILPLEGFHFYRRHIPADRLIAETVPDVGHCVQHDRPRWLVERLARYLRYELPTIPSHSRRLRKVLPEQPLC